jgi:organic radical activating enzyme
MDSFLPVMESFYTIQGEGRNTGRAAFFIRLGGCDVGCVWCDVKESWPAEAHPLQHIHDLLHAIQLHPCRFVVITGGEPALYDLTALTRLFHVAGLELAIETSGAHPLSGTWNWVCVSPKKFKAPLPEVLQRADELKVVIFNKSDFEWAEEHAKQVPEQALCYLQPEYSRKEEMLPLIIEYVKTHPRWRISLQTHKIIDVP